MTVVDAIHAVRSPVMLVGHSLGGMTISGAAERIAERIARWVYLTALVPRDGDSAADFGQLAGFNASVGSEMLEDGERAGVKTELARHLFYADCDRQTAERAVAALVATDLSYLTTPVTVSPDRFGVIPKTYILCLRDNAIEPRAQRVLATVHPGTDICEIDAGHSAFLSRPRELAALIDRL